MPDEASQQSMDEDAAPPNSEQPAVIVEAPADSVPPEQPTAAAAQLKGLAESSSAAYLRVVFPDIDSMLAENDFSSPDAQKR